MPQSFSQGMKLSARAVQVQQQRMSQQQIMSLNVLALPSLDLRDEIYTQAAKNPALEIVSDSLETGAKTARESHSRFSDNMRYGSVTQAGQLASDTFQAALESHVDDRETLQEHLERQFNAVRHSPEEETLGLRLIHNLDANGFHLLAPISLLDKDNPAHTTAFLQACMEKIRALDPVGTCTSGAEESLFVQAKLRGDAPDVALFLLDGHLAFLNPPQSAKVLKKIAAFLADQQTLSFADSAHSDTLARMRQHPFTQSDIDQAISYIRTLDPYPARNFGTSTAQYIAPDVYVEKIPQTEEDEANGIVETGGYSFKLTLARESVPRLAVSKEFTAISAATAPAATEQQKAERKWVQDSIRDAKVFIESVQFRETTIAKACAEIVRSQARFFAEGPRYVAPLRQKDIAERLGVHEATISRMANGKYLQCEWGLFALSYFFTNAVGAATTTNVPATATQMRAQTATDTAPVVDGAPANSKESVKYEIAQILQAHKDDKKPLSDQKLADALLAKGIKVARRTVAKYRAELNISSSYER